MANISYETVQKKLAADRVMLIGGAGFIGHHLALELRRIGVETMVVDNLMLNNLVDNVFSERDVVQRRAYLNFLLSRHSQMRESGVLLRNADARMLVDLSLLFDEFNPTHVVHLSAIASSVDAKAFPGAMFDLQLVTLRNILELMRSGSYHLVKQVMFLSSSTVYGDFKVDSVNEGMRCSPRGIYANTKYMAERLLRTYSNQYGIGNTIIRPSALYGERCISRRVSQVFIENAMTGKPLLLEGGGTGKLDFTDINDLINGMVRALALHSGPGGTETYNLTLGNARTIAELAGIVKEVFPNANLEERPRVMDKPIRGTLSTERAQEQLGFKPESTLEKGYRRYCQWYVSEWKKAQAQVAAGDLA